MVVFDEEFITELVEGHNGHGDNGDKRDQDAYTVGPGRVDVGALVNGL